MDRPKEVLNFFREKVIIIWQNIEIQINMVIFAKITNSEEIVGEV